MTTSKRKGMQMRVNRKRMRPLFVAAAVMIAVSGCSGQGKETENTSETATEKGTETQAVLEKVTYTSSDGSVSIILPDSGWVNTEDAGGKLSFSAEGKGEITIDYADSKKAVGTLAFGSTETKLKKRMEKLGVPVDAVEISDYTFDASTGIRKCSYTMKRTDAAAENVCTVTAVTAVSTRGYQVSGSIKTEDEALLAAVKESVNSFLVLQNPLTAEEQTETEAGQGEDASGSGSDEERYFFDEPGNTIYVKQNGDGVWVDKNGMAYKFYENGVEDSNGTKYYYDPPSYRKDSSGGSSDSGSTAEYYDFYDKDGNYIKATQDENGNWVGDDGKTYIFGEKGVTDSKGNFHPY